MELFIHNFRGLENFSWSPQPGQISVLVGANGSGKSAVCAALHFMTRAWRSSPSGAAQDSFRTPKSLRLRKGTSASYMGIKIGTMRWCVTTDTSNGAIRARGSCSIDDQKVKTQDVVDAYYDLYPTVYQSGCFMAATRGLDDRLLWLVREVMQDDVKREFVTDGLAGAFPNLFEEIVITSKNNVLVRERGHQEPSDLYTLPSGFLQLLGVLCAVACTPDDGTVVFDDPTLSLHPYAVKTLVDRVNRWAWEYRMVVLMMTHSTVMLNEFAGMPDRVFMMKRRQQAPVALTEAYDQGWLQGFGLGDLYENDNIGSNMDVLSEPRDPELPMPAPLTDWYGVAWFSKENNATVSLGDLAIGDLYATASIASNDDDRE